MTYSITQFSRYYSHYSDPFQTGSYKNINPQFC